MFTIRFIRGLAPNRSQPPMASVPSTTWSSVRMGKNKSEVRRDPSGMQLPEVAGSQLSCFVHSTLPLQVAKYSHYPSHVFEHRT